MKLQTTLSLAVAVILLAAVPAGAIVGGYPTTPDQFPYYVTLQVYKYNDLSRSAQCGGSVIDTGWILTAAHCITDKLERNIISIEVLVHDVYPRYEAIGLIIHPLWDQDNPSGGHDLALVRIPDYATEAHNGVPEAMKVQVGAPADPGAYAPSVAATMVGHGDTFAGSGPSPVLRAVNIPLQSDDYMDRLYKFWFVDDMWNEPLMIGAGWSNHTVCFGDSGGPLTVDRVGVTVQVGVASFVRADYDTHVTCDAPAAYSELSGPQLAWVAATLPGVAARWGSCAAGVRFSGHWVATYVWGLPGYLPGISPSWELDFLFPDLDSGYKWKITCVQNDLVNRAGPAPAPPGPVVH